MIQFYNVKKKQKVLIAEDKVEKVKIEKPSKNGVLRTRYAFKAVDEALESTNHQKEKQTQMTG